MNANDYQKESKATAIYPEEKGLEYETIGLASEVGEVCEKFYYYDATEDSLNGLLKEVGGVLWYIARLCDRFDYRMERLLLESRHLSNTEDGLSRTMIALSFSSGHVCNQIKKIIRDDDGIITDQKRHQIWNLLTYVVYFLGHITYNLGSTLEVEMENNYNQLMSRKDRGVIGGSGDDR